MTRSLHASRPVRTSAYEKWAVPLQREITVSRSHHTPWASGPTGTAARSHSSRTRGRAGYHCCCRKSTRVIDRAPCAMRRRYWIGLVGRRLASAAVFARRPGISKVLSTPPCGCGRVRGDIFLRHNTSSVAGRAGRVRAHQHRDAPGRAVHALQAVRRSGCAPPGFAARCLQNGLPFGVRPCSRSLSTFGCSKDVHARISRSK